MGRMRERERGRRREKKDRQRETERDRERGREKVREELNKREWSEWWRRKRKYVEKNNDGVYAPIFKDVYQSLLTLSIEVE